MLPELNAQMQSRESQVSAFLGIHYGEGPSMGQAEETQNLSTARFPALCTREGRAQEGTWTNATGIYYRGGLITVAGSKLYFDGVEIGDITPGEKQFATVNSKIVIFPDKLMVDSVDKTITRMEASAEIAAGMAEVVAGAEPVVIDLPSTGLSKLKAYTLTHNLGRKPVAIYCMRGSLSAASDRIQWFNAVLDPKTTRLIIYYATSDEFGNRGEANVSEFPSSGFVGRPHYIQIGNANETTIDFKFGETSSYSADLYGSVFIVY